MKLSLYRRLLKALMPKCDMPYCSHKVDKPYHRWCMKCWRGFQ